MKGVFQKECPVCGSTAASMSPVKTDNERAVVFVCLNKKCSHTFKVDGGAFVKNEEELKKHFMAGRASDALERTLLGERLNPSTRALLMANIIEYGLSMWNDGMKVGLVIGATRDEHNRISDGESPD